MNARRIPATTGDLIDFVLKRLAEDHAAADNAMANLIAGNHRGAATRLFTTHSWYPTNTRTGETIVAADPRRALDDVAARRKLVLLARGQIERNGSIGIVNAWREVVRALAQAYHSHPEYRPEWAPTQN